MSQWIDRINNNPIWEELKSLGPTIDRAVEREEIDATAIDGLERLRTVLTFCGKRLAATDPVLIAPRFLKALSSHLSLAKTEIESFVTDGAVQHIATANDKADDLLTALAAILAPIATDDLTVINESVSSYRSTLENILQTALAKQKELSTACDSTQVRITGLETTLTSEQQKLSTLVLEHQTQFSTAQDKRASDFSEVLTGQLAKYAASAAEQQTQFSKDQDARKSEYAASQISNKEQVASLIADYAKKLNEKDVEFAEILKATTKTHETNLIDLKASYEASAKTVLDQINTHKRDVESLVGVIGTLGVTSGYQKVANIARRNLYIWQGVTVVALLGLIGVALQLAIHAQTNVITVEASKIAISAVSPSATQSTENTIPSATPKASIQSAPPPFSDSAFY